MTVLEPQHERVIQTMVDLVMQPAKRGAIHITATLANDPRRRPRVQPATGDRVLTGAPKDTDPS